MTYERALEIVETVSRNSVHGPYRSDVIHAAALAGAERSVEGIVAVLEADKMDSLRGIADGAWPL